MRYFGIIILLFSLLVYNCSEKNNCINIYVDPETEYQVINGFGASDAWRCQFVGANWPEEKREAIADLLFSKEFDEKGNPRGIGLSLWRFYLGAGSYEQGVNSGIENPWRRAECFLDNDGNYDWSKYRGQRWFLKAAKDRGVENFLAFTISPPVFYTLNNKAFPYDKRQTMNIREGKLQDYAEYLVNIIYHFEQQGITFNYLSPVNEPQWAWNDGTQEGTPAQNSEIAEFVRFLSEKLNEKKLNTKITLPEAAELKYLYEDVNEDDRDNQVYDFFDPSSNNYIGCLPNVARLISGHSYFTTWPVDTLLSRRIRLNNRIRGIDPGLKFWQSEFCILENNDEINGGESRDLGIKTALYVARVIHYDLTVANASSWQWWTAISQFDFKDGLIYLDDGKSNGVRNLQDSSNLTLMSDGSYHTSKLLWAFGNYSRFVRPGMIRIKTSVDSKRKTVEGPDNLMVSGYKEKNNEQLVIVIINHSPEDQIINIKVRKGKSLLINMLFTAFVTSETKDLERDKTNGKCFSISPKSVTTLVGHIDKKDT